MVTKLSSRLRESVRASAKGRGGIAMMTSIRVKFRVEVRVRVE